METTQQNAKDINRQELELLMGRLYFVDTAASAVELNRALDPLWLKANSILKALFGDQTLQFHMFRQPSYMAAVRHAVAGMPGIDERTKYQNLISLFLDDRDLAIKRLEGPLPMSR